MGKAGEVQPRVQATSGRVVLRAATPRDPIPCGLGERDRHEDLARWGKKHRDAELEKEPRPTDSERARLADFERGAPALKRQREPFGSPLCRFQRCMGERDLRNRHVRKADRNRTAAPDTEAR